MEQEPVCFSIQLTYKETVFTATLKEGGLLVYNESNYKSLKDFCDVVTKNKTNGQLMDRILVGPSRIPYTSIKPKLTATGQNRLVEIYNLLCSIHQNYTKEDEPHESEENDEVGEKEVDENEVDKIIKELTAKLDSLTLGKQAKIKLCANLSKIVTEYLSALN